jgi:pSer/pThr/pTyr-binding forkhead associated (FHA) protein
MTYQLTPLERGGISPIRLQRPVLLVGRHPECDIRIESSKISRRHCCLAIAYDRILIRDLGSRNGVRVNGRLVEEARLHAGDEVAIGPFLYRIEAEPVGHTTASKSSGTPKPRVGRAPEFGETSPALSALDDEIGLVPLDEP